MRNSLTSMWKYSGSTPHFHPRLSPTLPPLQASRCAVSSRPRNHSPGNGSCKSPPHCFVSLNWLGQCWRPVQCLQVSSCVHSLAAKCSWAEPCYPRWTLETGGSTGDGALFILMKVAQWCMKPKYLDFQGNENTLLFCLVQPTKHGLLEKLDNSVSCDDGNPPLPKSVRFWNWLQNLALFLVERLWVPPVIQCPAPDKLQTK